MLFGGVLCCTYVGCGHKAHVGSMCICCREVECNMFVRTVVVWCAHNFLARGGRSSKG